MCFYICSGYFNLRLNKERLGLKRGVGGREGERDGERQGERKREREMERE